MGFANILLTIHRNAANVLADSAFTTRLGNALVELQCGLFLHARKQMGVNVERCSYCGVSQPPVSHIIEGLEDLMWEALG